jgi:betaine-aldehyde dehydrogenase
MHVAGSLGLLCCSAELESRNSGKPLPEALWDLDDVSACYEYYATLARELDTKQNEPAPDMPQGTDYKATMRYEAAGVSQHTSTYTYKIPHGPGHISSAF